MKKRILVLGSVGLFVMFISINVNQNKSVSYMQDLSSDGSIIQSAYADATNSATLTPTVPITSTPSAVPTLASTTLNFEILLHGIGTSGDNANPNNASFSNKNPLHPQRDFSVVIFDSNNVQVATYTDSLIYNTGQGDFTDKIDLGSTFPPGNYSIKVQTDRYLWKLIPGIVAIKSLTSNNVTKTALVAGDIKKDNILNVLDYNILLDCGYGAINPLPISDPNSLYNSNYCKGHNEFRPNSDLDDNGIVNSTDYNLFLREISVQTGD